MNGSSTMKRGKTRALRPSRNTCRKGSPRTAIASRTATPRAAGAPIHRRRHSRSKASTKTPVGGPAEQWMADHVERQVAREVVERGAEETEDGLRQRMVEERLRRRRVIRDAVLVEERRERNEIRVERPCHDGDLFGGAAGI